MNDNIKRFLSTDWLFLSMLLVIVAVASFGLGRLAERADHSPTPAVPAAVVVHEAAPVTEVDQMVVASKKGSKYHLPWCPGASQMKAENKIEFQTIRDAEAAGYTPAANCKGL